MNNMEINKMDDAALEGVSGGAGISGCRFSGRVRPEDCVPGKYYYVVMRGSYVYGQATGITFKDGRTMLGIRTASVDGRASAMPFSFNADQIEVYTTMTASC